MTDLSVNRRATFDHEILETYEAGVELFGFEVKAILGGRMTLAGAFVVMKNTEAWLLNAGIMPLQPKNTPLSYQPDRSRRLLLHKAQIRELMGKTSQKGLTIIPLKAYTRGHRIKLLIGLAEHKKQHDKRETIRRRDAEREMSRERHKER